MNCLESDLRAIPHECDYDHGRDKLEPVAVIGFSLRFPQEANSPESFWSTLVERRCTSTAWPRDRLNFDAFYHPDTERKDTIPVCGAHFLEEDLAAFDAPFFSITSTEAASMDPQQRGLLETAYHALENAGLPMERISGSKTGVYTGSFADDYKLMILKDPEVLPTYAATGGAMALLANRLSWFFNLGGPSVNLDTACSSSLMALDIACQGLRDGESTMALVAGSNTIFGLDPFLCLTNMNFLSPDGRCYSFDERANGYARGEGFGVVVIKLLKNAVRDGDTIRAVIRSTSSNQDGRTPGITQPSRDAQESLIKSTYAKAGLDPSETRYFEAHGTGTAVGDPTEASAIGRAFRQYRKPGDPLYVGAVKSNIGHLEGASGIAGLIKTIMVLEKGIIPPNANFESLNSKIDAEFLNLRFPLSCIPWPDNALRRASVNSFGFGGTNSHAILDDAFNFLRLRKMIANHSTVENPSALPDYCHSPKATNGMAGGNGRSDRSVNGAQFHEFDAAGVRVNGVHLYDVSTDGTHQSEQLQSRYRDLPRPKLLVWSAADEGGIDRLSQIYSYHFGQLSLSNEDANLYFNDLAYTLAARRSSLPWRSFVVGNFSAELSSTKLPLSKPVRSTERVGLGLLFTGQGAQFSEMGRELLTYPVFEDVLRRAETCLRELGCKWSLIGELLRKKTQSNVNDPEFSQPLCTALQIALVELLRSFNVIPLAVVGHSSGEIAAAYCLGGLSLRSACKVAFFRGKLTADLARSSLERGSMMAVGLSEAEVHPFLEKLTFVLGSSNISVACINSPQNVTLAGPEVQIDALKLIMDEQGVFVRKLHVEVAYHSPQMNEIANQYLTSIDNLELGRPCVAVGSLLMISSVTAKQVSADEVCQSEYWVRNMVSPVRFSDAVAQLISQSTKTPKKKLGQAKHRSIVISDLLEIGPHSALRGPTKEILESSGKHKQVNYSSVLVRHVSALETLFDVMGRFHCLGYPIKVTEVNEAGTEPVRRRKALTCLPKYPFDHTQKYWYENRLSREYRLRESPHLDLLGNPASDWNPLNARWRKFIRLTETPWVEDHKVNGSMVYPAAGMLVMAIEGMRQLADRTRLITGYRVEEATFHKTISIPTAQEGVETQLCIMPSKASSDHGSAPSDFTIYVLEDGHWEESCRGTIEVEYEEADTAMDKGKEDAERARYYERRYRLAKEACSRTVNSDLMYEHLQSIGFHFGPAFRTLRKIACNDEGEAVAEVGTFQWTTNHLASHRQPPVIHPTTLDGVAQLFSVALTRGGRDVIPTTIPTRLRNLWISNSHLAHSAPDAIQAYTKSAFIGYQGTESMMFALEKPTGKIMLLIGCLETTTVASYSTVSQERSEERKLCHSIEWKPDVDFLKPQQTLSYCRGKLTNTPEPIDLYQDFDLLVVLYMSKCLYESSRNELAGLSPYLQTYIAWIEWRIERLEAEDKTYNRADWKTPIDDAVYMDYLSNSIEKSGKQGKCLVNIGRDLLKIIHGEMDPSVLSDKGSLAEDYHREVFEDSSCCKYLEQYLGLLAHKDPASRVLEVGAGTGGLTSHVLHALSAREETGHGAPRYAKYDCTDSSQPLLEKVTNTFRKKNTMINFRELDIECNPQQQGFELGSYDLLIAKNLLHTTQDLHATMQNVRSLLKPGGRLILIEITKPNSLRVGFLYGLLPRWWLNTENYRERSFCLSEDQWREVLSHTGFSGVDMVFRDYQDETCHEMSVIVSTAIEKTSKASSSRRTSILVEDQSAKQKDLARMLKRRLDRVGNLDCEIVSLQAAVASAKNSAGNSYIFLPEIERPSLHDLDADSYMTFHTILCSAQELLWVTIDSQKSPEYGMVAGLARVLRSENGQLKFLTLALESRTVVIESKSCVDTIATVFERAVAQPLDECESEYLERDGMIYINRLIEAKGLNCEVDSKTRFQQHKMLGFGLGPPLKLTIASPGLLDSLQFVQDRGYSKPLAAHEVEIEVRAVGVNLRDCLIVLGRVKESTLGAEFAGVVSRIGGECGLQPGDRVCGCILGCFSTYARGNAQLVTKIPDDLAFSQAAALPVTFVTAWHSLVEVARLQRGESILIHSASGGTGQAAIQVAKLLGAEVFITVGFEKKKMLIMDLYGIPEDRIFYSRSKTFVQSVKRMTDGHGVDVVLNSLSGKLLFASWECIAPYGRFLEIGKKDINSNSKLPMFPFKKNVSFCTVDTAAMSFERPELFRKSLVAVMTLVAEKKLHAAQPLHVYSVSEVEQAFRYMQGGSNTGKTVVEMDKSDLVHTVLDTKPEYYFDAQATYLIAGGLGGLGRSAARWMVQRGVRNLILLSRFGPKTDASIDMVNQLRTQGVHVEVPACDITSASAISAVLEYCGKIMPPIKGCIQGTMILRDGIFESMTFEDWNASVKAKVQGSWNLHTHLPSGMDFFIMLSSVAGVIGSGGQANYAAGNTYMDALARYRIARGEKAVSLDLGWMKSEGVVAANEYLEKGFAAAGFLMEIRQEELHALLDHYCDPTRAVPTPLESQIVVGLETPAAVRAKGGDGPSWMLRPTFRSMFQIGLASTSSSSDTDTTVNYAALFKLATSPAEASNVVSDGLVNKLSKALSIPNTDIDTNKALHAYGVDSLLAVELRNWFAREFDADVAIFDIMGAKDFAAIALLVAEKSKFRQTT